jgi:hypothetical protein
MDSAQIALLVAAILHSGFIIGEMITWQCPLRFAFTD